MIKRKNLTEIKIWKIIEKIGLQAQQYLCRYLRIRKKHGPDPCFLLEIITHSTIHIPELKYLKYYFSSVVPFLKFSHDFMFFISR